MELKDQLVKDIDKLEEQMDALEKVYPQGADELWRPNYDRLLYRLVLLRMTLREMQEW